MEERPSRLLNRDLFDLEANRRTELEGRLTAVYDDDSAELVSLVARHAK
jgi:hypothetical protein